jgi:hypothetical protein
MAEVLIIFGPEWKELSIALAEAEATAEEKLGRTVREEAEKKAEEARMKVRALPAPGPKHTGLRERVAQGVEVKDGGVGDVEVSASMAAPNEAIIPLGLDRPEGWRHPLFGNRRHWYANPGYSWFRETFESAEGEFEDELDQTLDRIAQEIAH